MENECVDLIYLDPPYNTGKIWSGAAFEFDDKFESLSDYLEFLRVRLIECRRVLKQTGSIYLHCDWRTNHHIRILMDEIFGTENFRNEIVWHYAGTGGPTTHYPRKHDVILFYSKEQGKNTFNPQRVERKGGGHSTWNGKWGKLCDDVWSDIRTAFHATERQGYPTQKPIQLLARIIQVSSNPGDTVLDPFCGSGTTLVAAEILNRKWIGIDKNQVEEFINKRLAERR